MIDKNLKSESKCINRCLGFNVRFPSLYSISLPGPSLSKLSQKSDITENIQ